MFNDIVGVNTRKSNVNFLFVARKKVIAAVSIWLLLPIFLGAFLLIDLNSANSIILNLVGDGNDLIKTAALIAAVLMLVVFGIWQVCRMIRAAAFRAIFFDDLIIFRRGLFGLKISVRPFCGAFRAIRRNRFGPFQLLKSKMFNYDDVLIDCPGGPNELMWLRRIKNPDQFVTELNRHRPAESMGYNYLTPRNSTATGASVSPRRF